MAFLRYSTRPQNLELVAKTPEQEESLMVSFLARAVEQYSPGKSDIGISREEISKIHNAGPRSLPTEVMAKILTPGMIEVVNEQNLSMDVNWQPNSIKVYRVSTYKVESDGYSIPLDDDEVAMQVALDNGCDAIAYQLDMSKQNSSRGYDHHFSAGHVEKNRGRTYTPIMSILHAQHPVRQLIALQD